MLRVLQDFTRTSGVLRVATKLAAAPLWRMDGLLLPSLTYRRMAQRDQPDDDEDIMPEGRKNHLRKRSSPSFQAPVRAHLDVIKYVPIVDHFLLLSGSMALAMPKAEYDGLSEYFDKSKKYYVAATVVKNPNVLSRDQGAVIVKDHVAVSNLPPISSSKEVFDVGVLLNVQAVQFGEDRGGKSPYLMLTPKGRIKITQWVDEPRPVGSVRIEEIVDVPITEDDLDLEQQVIYRHATQLIQDITRFIQQANVMGIVALLLRSTNLNEFVKMALVLYEMICKVVEPALGSPKNREVVQDIFAETNLTDRLEKLCTAFVNMRKRLEVVAKIESRAAAEADERAQAKQEEKTKEEGKADFREGMKRMVDDRVSDMKRFRKNLEGKKVPQQAIKRFDEEANRYLSMDPHHSESTVIRTYLDYLSSLPWGVTTEDRFDMKGAKEILDEGHYGMDDIKQRILEFLAVGKLQGKVQGKILCFVGPPGVGKTSIGQSIAKAVNRKFFRISVGGDRDTSTLKGFRRTYVGAIPGKIIQGLRNVQVENPVILIDEIDKLGERSVHGDPSSVLLEILDPEQNTNFTDDYVDIPVDLSKVLFLCTANTLNTIPKPLLDRMEIINVAGYTHAEKRHILNRYLLPQEMDRAGLTGKDKEFSITDDAKNEMIVNYCREPGVRGLQRSIKRIMERLALKMVTNEKDLTVSAKNLEDYIGNPPFHSARIYPQTPSGVVCGLGWTELGGSILYIEAREFTVNREKIEHPGTGQVKITGSLGDVMKESVSIAHTLAKNFLNTYFPSHPASSYLDYHDIHVHIPEGGIPKEGPSAGVTLTTAFLSAALGQPVAQDVAMTGEVTLRGKVLAIGGVKEKVLAAQREGIKKVILPKKNEKDFMRLPEFLRKDIEVAYAEDYVDVFKIMFPDLLPQNQAKQEQRATI